MLFNKFLNNQDQVKIGWIKFACSELFGESFGIANTVLLVILVASALFLYSTSTDNHPVISDISLAFIASCIFFWIVHELPRIKRQREKILHIAKLINNGSNDLHILKFILVKEIQCLLKLAHESGEPGDEFILSRICEVPSSNVTFDSYSLPELVLLFKPDYLPIGAVNARESEISSPLCRRIIPSTFKLGSGVQPRFLPADFRFVTQHIMEDIKEDVKNTVEEIRLFWQMTFFDYDTYKKLLDIEKNILPRGTSTIPEVLAQIGCTSYTDMTSKKVFLDLLGKAYEDVKNRLSKKYFVKFPEFDVRTVESNCQSDCTISRVHLS